jgi:imidazolonepropionase-like amidohydrolase
MRTTVSILLAATLLAAPPASAQQARIAADSGTIRLHLLGREVGRETYTLRRAARGLVLTDSFTFVDRGGRVQLTTSLAVEDDLTPVRLRAQGRTYRFLNIDVDVEVNAGLARVRSLGDTADVRVPGPFFTVQGYAPLAARALLIGYWESHGRPARLTTVPGRPSSTVSIERRGDDVVERAGGRITLHRYSVQGVAWGREVVWLDADGRLAAIFTRANVLPFEGVREDLLPARPALERAAVMQQLHDLARLAAASRPVADGTFALVGAQIVDGTGRPPVPDGVVLVRAGVIAAVGPRGSISLPRGVTSIDVRGATIVPGLWDMHAHAAQIEWGPAYLAAGVTTARDMGGEYAFLTAFRDAIRAGRGIGPRLLLAGLVDGENEGAFGTVTAATAAQGVAAVERYHAAGFDQLKLYTWVAPDVVRAITQRAHALGMTVTGHLPRALSLEQALEAGMDQIAHMPISGAAGSAENRARIAALVAHGTVIDPTLSWGELLGRAPETPVATFQPGISGAPWPIAWAYGSVRNNTDSAAAAARLRQSLAALRALHDAGLPIVAGTDYGVPGHSLHRELELYVLAGLSPMEAIRAATAVPARVMGMAAEAGTIEPGKRADLLVLAGDPLQDISNIRRGRWVVAKGVMYECTALWQAADFEPLPRAAR